jgi:hypothetical protein
MVVHSPARLMHNCYIGVTKFISLVAIGADPNENLISCAKRRCFAETGL